MLQSIMQLDAEGPINLVPTFLGAHAIPPEYKDNPDRYTDLVCNQMLPAVKDWWTSEFNHTLIPDLPYVDVFCETGAFSLGQSRRILETAKELGFPLKIHADEFDNLGGASLAAELGAASADHLVVTSQADIRALGEFRHSCRFTALYAIWSGRGALFTCQRYHRGKWDPGYCNGYESRYGLVRKHAVRDCFILPLHGVNPCSGHCSGYPERRCSYRGLRSGRFD